MDKLTQELMESVDKNLPQLVGDQLKARLTQADKDKETAAKVPALESMVAECKKKLEGMDTREQRIAARESAATEREAKVTLREALLDVKELHAQERVKEMRGVVQDVFANSKFKYQDNGYTSGPNGGGSVNRTVETSIVPDR